MDALNRDLEEKCIRQNYSKKKKKTPHLNLQLHMSLTALRILCSRLAIDLQ